MEQRSDGALAERQQRLDQIVVYIVVSAPDRLDEEIERLGTLPVTEQVHQQGVEVDAVLLMRSARKGESFLGRFRTAVQDCLDQAPVDTQPALGGLAQ